MLARAKLNLALHVTGRRKDGYHLLDSLVAFADFGDEVAIAPAQRDQLSVDGPFADMVPDLADNTLGAALAMVRAWGLAASPLHIQLTKNMPAASGIGGGSADAAALIRLIVGSDPLTPTKMGDCLALGADVPMCVASTPAIIGGIGEDIKPVQLPPAHIVLVNPRIEVSTPAIFNALASKTNPKLDDWPNPTTFSGLVAYLQGSRNDLMEPAIAQAPVVAACLEALSSAPFARMSGSGATCFALLETEQEAHSLAATVARSHPDWWVKSGQLGS